MQITMYYMKGLKFHNSRIRKTYKSVFTIFIWRGGEHNIGIKSRNKQVNFPSFMKLEFTSYPPPSLPSLMLSRGGGGARDVNLSP